MNKTLTNKNQENSEQFFGENYLTNRLVKFLQDCIKPLRVRDHRVRTGHQFFLTNSLLKILLLTLAHRVIHIKNIH